MIKEILENKLRQVLEKQVALFLSKNQFGDFCLPPAQINKILEETNKKLDQLVSEIRSTLEESGLVDKVEYVGGFINIYLSKDAYLQEMNNIAKTDSYLIDENNAVRTIVFDYSSPNIAKPFSIGHLRSTIIGQANYNIHKSLGYKTIGINHIGDWGTQFGKLIVAIKKWGNDEEIKSDPISKLNELYVKFHQEARSDEGLEDEAREWFRKLEGGDPEAREIWRMCVDESFKEFERIYSLLGVNIDKVMGESEYEDSLEDIVSELKQKGLLKDSQGAKIVELEDMPPALIKKNDGATLYITRDLSALKYRIEKYNPEKIIYHVGNDQSLHFKQLQAVAQKLGWLKKNENSKNDQGNTEIVFAGHGMIRLPEGKMSTRSGRTVLLEDLIGKAKLESEKIITQKGNLRNVDEVSEKIAISAIKYADLSQNRKSDIVFSFDKMISLKGNSSVYLQYTLSRIKSIERIAIEEFADITPISFIDEDSRALARVLIGFRDAVVASAFSSSPNILSDYIFRLANEFNSFYEKKRIISQNKDETSKNLFVVTTVKKVLEKCFELLGISVIEKI